MASWPESLKDIIFQVISFDFSTHSDKPIQTVSVLKDGERIGGTGRMM